MLSSRKMQMNAAEMQRYYRQMNALNLESYTEMKRKSRREVQWPLDLPSQLLAKIDRVSRKVTSQ